MASVSDAAGETPAFRYRTANGKRSGKETPARFRNGVETTEYSQVEI
jgi:hypothetical protein